MCGRTACTLAPDDICKACSYSTKASGKGKRKYIIPQWKDHPGSYTYYPSTNVAPSKFTPVLIKNPNDGSSVKRDNEGKQKQISKYIVQPMMWGLVPHFYKGESPKGYGFSTNNCRIEDIHNKKTFKPSLNNNQRCVILCDGFYEWQTTKGSKNKQPYFIHAPQEGKIEIWNKETWPKDDDLWSEEEGWKGPQLLKVAGLYSIWMSTEGEEFYTYSVVTMEADKKFSWLHHRIPAILESYEDVERWLDEDDSKSAISNLTNHVTISSYPVSSLVNNSRNHDDDLMFPVDLKKEKPDSKGSKFMRAWLKTPSSKSSDIEKEEVKEEAKVKPEELE